MGNVGKVCPTFCACYDDKKHKNTYSEFFIFSMRMRSPSKIFLKSPCENGMTPPIFSLADFRLAEGNAEFFSEKTSSSKVGAGRFSAENIFNEVDRLPISIWLEFEELPSAPPQLSNEQVEMLTIKECAQQVSGLSEHTIRQLVLQNKLPHIRTGQGKRGKILVPKSALLNYLKSAALRFLIVLSTFE